MKYLEFTFTLSPSSSAAQDVLCAVLGEAGFDSFVPSDSGENPLMAYVKADLFREPELKESLSAFPLPQVEVDYSFAEAQDKDWNKVWEENYFQPLQLGSRCIVYGTMHRDVPEAEYRIVINPKMSFGTGHHATTSQMMLELLDADLSGYTVLDMGCGTSILAILVRMRGATSVTAIDNDEWCVLNSRENIQLNGVDGIDVSLGDADSLADKGPFDLVLANINRNILLADMDKYVARMKQGARLFMSGFYEEDVPVLRERAEQLGLTFDHVRSSNRWACAVFCLQKTQ